MRTLSLAALCLLALAACRKPAPQEATPAGEKAAEVALIDYAPADKAYACLAPADWKADEDDRWGPGVSFLGPRGHSISILKYPSKVDRYATPEDYLSTPERRAAGADKVRRETLGGRRAYRFYEERLARNPFHTSESYAERLDVVLIPVEGGFYRLDHAAPATDYQATLPVFEAVVGSFRLPN